MLIPATRYADCEAALAFLKDVIGMEELTVYRNDAGQIAHAELKHGQSAFMFGPEVDNDFGRFVMAPRNIGLRETTTTYVVVADVAAHHANAVAHKVEIIVALNTSEGIGEAYSLRDPEGHIWSIGSYDPFSPTPA